MTTHEFTSSVHSTKPLAVVQKNISFFDIRPKKSSLVSGNQPGGNFSATYPPA